MENSRTSVPAPRNEPVLGYLPNSEETRTLRRQLETFSKEKVEIGPIVDGREVHSGKSETIAPPHRFHHKLGEYHQVTDKDVDEALRVARRVAPEWARTPVAERAAIFLKAGELLATKYRPILNAATMLGQSKTCHQAEIDSACELIDFFRFNVHFQETLYAIQPNPSPGIWNQLEYRPLEGFVYAVTPFNFTSIGGNLPTAPALMGNVVLWKPASTSVYSNYFIMKLLEEAGLPPGVIQFLPGSGKLISDKVMAHPDFAGLHFTGSTATFQNLWLTTSQNLPKYRGYPRIVGETGGKDFVFVHGSAEPSAVVAALIRGAFEYQGQKCSAASRAYIPRSLWPRIQEQLVDELKTARMGDPTDWKNFVGAVIDKKSFENIRGYLDEAKASSEYKVIAGGKVHGDEGYFVEPTVLETTNPKARTMTEEIFGPVLSLWVYDDAKVDEALDLCDQTSPYALTGAVFARERAFVEKASRRLVNAAGNFYINTKPTGAVVGQQPFGGARGSGTNDKAGSLFNLMRWTSMRTISETFVPPTAYRYPFLGDTP